MTNVLTANMHAATIALCRYLLAHGTTTKSARVLAEALRRTLGDTAPPPRVNDAEPRARLDVLLDRLTSITHLTLVKKD